MYPRQSNYDPSSWDPSNFDGGQPSPNLAQVTISITNNIAATQTIELFNFLRSISKIYAAAVTTSNPIQAYENIAVNTGTGLPITADKVYFNEAGSLIIESAAGTKCTISCNTVPYRTLFEGSAFLPFNVAKFRYSFTTDPQLDKEIVIFERTIFGKYSENRLSPRTYLDPNQMQSKVVDIPVSFNVSGEVGVQQDIISGETVSFALFCNTWSRPAITQ